MDNNSVSVLVVDDHTLFRKGMVMMLKTFPTIKEVMDAENGKEAVNMMKERPFDLMLLDLDMPVMDGWKTSKYILKNYPSTHIIMVSMHDSLSIVSKLIELGVHSYLLKNASPEEVQKAIASVINNDFYYNQLVASALNEKMNSSANLKTVSESSNLTKREIEILGLICQELTMKEIGEQLFISEQTIHTHRKNLMRKIEAKNAVGLVKFAIQNQIVSM